MSQTGDEMKGGGFTPGPWSVAAYSRKRFGLGVRGAGAFFLLQCVHSTTGDPISKTDARLIASAPDHALLLRAITRGDARWVPWPSLNSGEVCIGGLCYATDLDEFGCPVVNSVMRVALEKVMELRQ